MSAACEILSHTFTIHFLHVVFCEAALKDSDPFIDADWKHVNTVGFVFIGVCVC